jgi:hypothetical protein
MLNMDYVLCCRSVLQCVIDNYITKCIGFLYNSMHDSIYVHSVFLFFYDSMNVHIMCSFLYDSDQHMK